MIQDLKTPRTIKKRDGKIDRFNPTKIQNAIWKAAKAVHHPDPEQASEEIFEGVMQRLGGNGSSVSISDIEREIIGVAREAGHTPIADGYESYRDQRAEARKVLQIMTGQEGGDVTDAALLIQSESKEVVGIWDRMRIAQQLEVEAELSHDYAVDIAKRAENMVVRLYQHDGIRRLNTTDVRGIVDIIMRQDGLESQRKKTALHGLSAHDVESIIFNKSAENSNIGSHNPEAVNLEIAERTQKGYALENVFSDEVADAHLNGRIHVHDLGYPARVYCSSHSIEYIKKYGLGKLLANLESKSSPTKDLMVLNQHVQTFLASMQAHYAGALGFGFVNILYAPLLKRPVPVVEGTIGGERVQFEERDLEKMIEQGSVSLQPGQGIAQFKQTGKKFKLMEVPYREHVQGAQNLVFASSQNAFSRGGQTLFIDLNMHTGIPDAIKNVPAIGPSGKYMVQMPNGEVKMLDNIPRFQGEADDDPRRGDADDTQLTGDLGGGHILVYGDFKETAQRFAKAALNVWRKGDRDGRLFRFPKCDIHVNDESFTDPSQEEIMDLACEVAGENGAPYFMFDRGNGTVLAQCCRLKERIEDPMIVKHPEHLRFTGFQNVTINLAQAAYRGKTLEGTLKEIDAAMELAYKAHEDKRIYMEKLLNTPGSPMRSLGVESDDGRVYIDLEKATYIIGNIGLNECVQTLIGQQLEDSEEAHRLGLEIIAHMNLTAQGYRKKTGRKFTLEESPAESATRRFAKVDLQRFPEAKKVVKGTEQNPYYTNSIHYAPGANIGIVDRIAGQSMYHDLIESGAIVHAWVGQKRPSPKAIKQIVKNTLYNTRCSQLTFSPTLTECDSCNNTMDGEVDRCDNPECPDPVGKVYPITKIVGYNSRLSHWNKSQVQIYEDRKKAEEQYAGAPGKEMPWLYSPNGHPRPKLIQFAKHDCKPCAGLKNTIQGELKRYPEGSVDFELHYLDTPTRQGLVEAAMYNVPLDTMPSLVIPGKSGFWSKTTEYAPKYSNKPNNLIRGSELRVALAEKAAEYGVQAS